MGAFADEVIAAARERMSADEATVTAPTEDAPEDLR